ncbi:MAG: putative aminohydrolase SsnA [Anaerolineales bacterium]|nr:putative aminohydrolase SsnA [Anaerolineales bacterium]
MLITNATLITWEKENRILPGHALYIEDGLIADSGPNSLLVTRYPDAEHLDAGGQLVMPGNICAHTHFYGAFARGMAIPGEAPADFKEILQKLWWPLDKSLTSEDVRYSALVCLIDALKHGVTTLFDHHASPNAIDGSLDVIAEAVEQAGVRAVLCYEVTDRDGPEKARAGIEENVRFIEKCSVSSDQFSVSSKQEAGGRRQALVAAMFGLHAPLTLSNKTLEACRAAVPEEVGFHIHVAESSDDGYAMFENDTGIAFPVDWLNKHGILGPKSIVAHAIHVDEYEMDQLAETETWVTHQPRSNMNNAVGVADVEQMLEKGIRVCLGNDGFSNAMWEEWKAAYLLHKSHHGDPRRMNGSTVVEMAVYNNAALASLYFPAAPLGVIAPGAAADLIFVDYHSPTPLSPENLPWHILFGFRDGMVTTTIVNGQILMEDRQLLTLDEAEIAARARELAPGVWERYDQQRSNWRKYGCHSEIHSG